MNVLTQRKLKEAAEGTNIQMDGEIRRLSMIINELQKRPNPPAVDYGLEIVRFEQQIVRYANEVDSL